MFTFLKLKKKMDPGFKTHEFMQGFDFHDIKLTPKSRSMCMSHSTRLTETISGIMCDMDSRKVTQHSKVF